MDFVKGKKVRIGLALSGGGAKGFAHAGALAALSEYGIVPDVVSGTSAGSVVGGFFCAGYDMKAMIELFLSKDVHNFIKLTVPTVSLFSSDGFLSFLDENLPVENFSDLIIPLRVVATDFDHGCSVVFKEGRLAPRIMASSTLPIFFRPRTIDGVRYVDGGIFRNFPATVIEDECDFLIGINVSPDDDDKYRDSLMYIAAKCYHYMFKANMVDDKAACDILVEVNEALQFKVFDLKKAGVIFDLGYRKMKDALEANSEILQAIMKHNAAVL